MRRPASWPHWFRSYMLRDLVDGEAAFSVVVDSSQSEPVNEGASEFAWCSVVFASSGFCGRELYAIDDRPNLLYLVGSMGCVMPFALGFALARPDQGMTALLPGAVARAHG